LSSDILGILVASLLIRQLARLRTGQKHRLAG
jgi:hypothetical protein